MDFLWHAAMTSLDVERKHNRDKQCEQIKVMGVAAASRNSLIQTYRLRRQEVVTQHLVLRRDAAKHKYMNARALAIQERPSLFARGRGKLWWEPDIDTAARKQSTTTGDEGALKGYVQEHWERLSQKALAMRKAHSMWLTCLYACMHSCVRTFLCAGCANMPLSCAGSFIAVSLNLNFFTRASTQVANLHQWCWSASQQM